MTTLVFLTYWNVFIFEQTL